MRNDGYTGYIYEFSTVSRTSCVSNCVLTTLSLVYGDCCGHGRKCVQWLEHFSLDVVGCFRPVDRCCPYLGLYGMYIAFVLIMCLMFPVGNLFNHFSGMVLRRRLVSGMSYTIPHCLMATPNSGNDHYLFQSAIFWLCLPIAFSLSLAPHYLWKAYQITWHPTDVDIMRIIRKRNPNIDFTKDPRILAGLPPAARANLIREHEQEGVQMEYPNVFRHSIDMRGSRTDMSTGIRSIHRGFDFATEEHGVAMQRIQTNLSEKRGLGGRFSLRRGGKDKRRQRSNTSTNEGHGPSRFFSLSRSLRKKPPPL